ncbi:MAG TPA: hypothetical protein VJI69_04810 [Bacteroidia bacterium]|nr:hypothetical protein [Bacteroidia bacterium]
MKFLTTLFLFVFSLGAFAQLVTNNPVEIGIGPIAFNSKNIKKNKIKKIDVVIVDKPDGEIIIDKGASQGYEFDSLGRVTRYYYTILNSVQNEEVEVPEIRRKGKIIQHATTKTVTKYYNDTIFADIYYDQQSRIITKRVKMGAYYNSYYYEYNEKGQIAKEMHFRETNVSENKNEFKMGVQNILSSETFEYIQMTPTQVKKRCLNDEGREYKKGIINYDEKGNKLTENYEFIVSWMRQENIFQYDAKGNLLEKTFTSNESGNVKEYTVYKYDGNGVVLEEKKFKNDALLSEMSYLYDETNTLLKSKINRDHKNNSIGIVKFGYSYY